MCSKYFLWIPLFASLCIGTAGHAQQNFGDWVFSGDRQSCIVATFSVPDGRVMFRLGAIPELPSAVRLTGIGGPTVDFGLYSRPGFPDGNDYEMRIMVDTAYSLSVTATSAGETLGELIQFNSSEMQELIVYLRQGSFLSVEPGRGFFSIGFSLRGSGRALTAWENCVSGL